MDILAALEATAVSPSGAQCCVARWLDTIPDDAPGKDVLVATFAQRDRHGLHYRRLVDLTLLAENLEFKVSQKTVMLHRNKDCACFGRSA